MRLYFGSQCAYILVPSVLIFWFPVCLYFGSQCAYILVPNHLYFGSQCAYILVPSALIFWFPTHLYFGSHIHKSRNVSILKTTSYIGLTSLKKERKQDCAHVDGNQ